MTIRFIRIFLLLAVFSFAIEVTAQCGNSGFTISSPRCAGQPITFVDTTTTAADSTLWRFSSGGTTVTNDSAQKTYSAATSDTVWMYRFYTSPDTCVDTVFAVFTVTDPTVTVSPAGPVNICTGGSTLLTANSGAGLTYQWLLNGAPIGGATNQTYTASANGTYSVVATGNGCSDTSNAVVVTVYNYPNADFVFGPDSACSGTTVNFINNSTGTSLTHSWRFGNAGTSTIANPNFVFDTSGTRSIVSYQVRLIASTPGNCNDTITKTVYVRRKPFPGLGDFNNIPPFIQCNVGSFPFSLLLDNISTTRATDASYSINWGDGTSQNFSLPFDSVTHVFATSGLFVVQITATDSAGCPHTRSVNVFNGGNPGVSLGNSGSTSGCTPYSINFTIDTSKATGVGNNADGTTYTYTFNDGSAPVTYTHPPPPIHNKIFSIPSCGVATPGFPNAYQVELVVSNPCGNNSSTIRPIYISTKPVAQIGIQPDGDTVCEDIPFIIYDDSDTGSVSSGSGCNETPRRLWNIFPATGWNLISGYFGNHGNWNNNPANWGSGSLQVEFDDTGTYTVRLIVGNIAQAGVSVCGDDTIERIIRVLRVPNANFTLNLNPVSGCVNSTITTNNTSTGDQLTYQWLVSPNSGYTLSSGTLTSATPTFVFNTPGVYIVSLIASNRCYTDTAQDTIVIKGPPTATLPGAQQYCGPRVISFADLVANTTHRPVYDTNFADTISYQWTVTGGGYTYTSGDSTSPFPSISLNDAGTYTVQVRITNECGTDTGVQVITIHPLPVADYSVNDTDQCINGNSFVFTNGTTISSGSITSYNWNFGQAPTSTLTNPTKTYTSTGAFNVRLIAVSNQGCRDTIIKQVVVFPKPTPNFTINDTDQCINGNNFIFTNTSSIAGGGTNTFLWTFTNRANDTSTQTSPTKVYDTVGNFAVKLVVTSNNGCKDSITRTLRVYPKPNPAFTVNDTDQCLNGNSFQFTNASSISSGTMTYTWKFGSSAADSSNATNPTKVYTADGNYTVKLIARSNNGCRDSVTGPVYVYPMPAVTYAVNDSDQCFAGNNFVFTNNSTISSGTVSYLWRFSNTANDTSTQTHPTKVYTSTGVFPVKLVGTSNRGCKDSITRNMTVYPEPLAGFDINDTDQCLNGNNFIFTDTSVVGGAYNRNWTFGDGGTSTTANPSHSYSSVDTFDVKLVVTITAGGCKDSVTRTVYTYPAPVPAFTVDDSVQCFPGHLFTFTNGSSISSGTNTYLWKFDAPSSSDTSTAANPTKTYAAAGTYLVRLIATSDRGCIDSAQRNVYPNPPILNNVISANQGICSGFAPDTLRQSGAAINGGNGSFTYSWYESSDSVTWFQLAGIITASYQPPVLNATVWYRRVVVSGPCSDTSAPVKITVTPAITNNTISANQTVCEGFAPAAFGGSTPAGGLGVYTFQWQQSTDSSNWSDIGSATGTTYQAGVLAQTTWFRRNITSGVCTVPSNVVKVQVNPKPSVSFNTASVCFGFNASYTSTSTVASGSITSYNWNFGDGNTGTGSSQSHGYAATGSYTVKLIATTDSSCTDSTTRTIWIHPTPVAAFTVNDTCLGFDHSFDASASQVAPGVTITAYDWNFGDATNGFGVTVNKTYAAHGSYNARLIVTTDSACRDTVTDTIVVHPRPVPNFTINDSDQCLSGNNFVYTNTSSIASGSSTYLWTLGEGSNDTSTLTSPTKTYAANGNYNVRVRATSNFGCIDSITRPVIVYSMPTPAFNINDSDQCLEGNTFVFNNTSSINPVVSLSYLWRFGDGSTSTTTSPNKSYAAEGTYPVRLVVTSTNNCSDSIQKTVYVRPMPDASFTINDTLQCYSGNLFIYTNTSTISSGTMTNFWRLNLANATDTSTQANVNRTYTVSGNLSVRLTVTSDYLCKDSVQRNIIVRPDITFNNIAPGQDICAGQTPNQVAHSGVPLNGGDGTFSYQWQESIDSSNWTNIGGATSAAYQPGALFDTTWYRRIVFSGPCSDTSAPIRIGVTPGIANNTISASQIQCGGFAPSRFNGSVPTGGSGNYSYQWQFSLDSTNWSDIAAATDTNYQAGVLTQTIWYRRGATSGTCTIYSTPVKVTVNPKPVASFNTASVCFGFNASYTSTSNVATGSITQYSWVFGDSATASGNFVQHNYAAFGTYTTKLIVTTDSGCKDSTTRVMRVHPKPVAAYTHNDTCHNDAHNFNATGSTVALGSITSYNWDFNDATTATGATANKTYASVGTYNVKLIVTSDSACRDSITKAVTVYPNPVPGFTVNDSDQCVNGNNFAFTNATSIASGSNTYRWNFGVSTTDTSVLTNPSKVYPSFGNYNVRLVATSNFGCRDSITKTMIVYAKPAQAFSINDTDQCVNGNNFTFTNGSTINPVVGLTYFWTFGNGDTSTQTNTTKVYASPGIYPVKLRVTSANGCVDSITKNVYVRPKPTPNFTINDTLQCFGPNVFTYTNTSSISSGTMTHFWKFNLSQANDTSSVTSPTKTYAGDGTFTVRLTVTSDHNCKDSIQKQVSVNPDIVNNAITANQFICQNDVPDTLRQTGGSVSGGDNTFSYQWQQSTDSANWSNIGSATDTKYGPPALSVTTWYRRIITSGPCLDTSNVVKVNVTPAIGNNTITANQDICEGFAPAKFIGALPTGGNGVFAYQWQISTDSSNWSNIGGGTDTSYQSGVLTQTRYYRRRVTSGMCTVISPPIKVTVNPKPSAGFTTANVCFGFNAGFASTSSVSAGSITSQVWAFGNGFTSSGTSTFHNYAAAGAYTVKLFITTDKNCDDSAIRVINIHPKPVAAYVHNDTCHDDAHAFNAAGSTVASGSITAYNWNLGDATTATGITTSKTYASVGSYNVKLVVTSDSSCRDSITKTVTVHPNPVPAFTVNDSDQCVNGNNFVFTNGSSISAGSNTYRWNFGSSTVDTSNAVNPNKVYAANGNYNVRLVAISNFGCKDSTTKQMVVYAKPAQAFAINDTDQCLTGNNFAFTNNTTINPAVGLTYLWTFGNGDTSTQTNPTKTYAAPGTYPVKLRVTSIHNCVDSVTKNMYVYHMPTANFTINDTQQCFGPNNFIFSNTSTISTGTLSHFWRFDLLSANDTSNLTSPTKVYATYGNFTVRLRTTSDKGCKDSIEKPVTVRPGITDNVITAPQFLCQNVVPDTIRTSGTISGGNGSFTYQWQQSTDSANWTNISSTSIDKYGPPALSVTTWYRRIVTSLACMDTSNVIKVSVTPAVGNNTITANQSICEGFTPAKFNGTLPTGGNGTYAYQWQHSSDSTTWTNIVGGNDTNYQAVTLTQTRFFRRSVTSGSCTVVSPPVKVTVNPKPTASFNTASVCFGFDANFTSTSLVSTGSITSYTWRFGDGNSGSGTSTIHNYSAFGTYTARLIVTTDSGCQDSTTRVLRVHPKPVAAYTHNDTCHTKNHSFNAVGSSVALGGITNYDWSFGDATSASGSTAIKTYAVVASYNVRLIVTSDSSCRDSITKTVTVHPNPVPAFTVNDSDQCVNVNNFVFTNGSSISTGSNTYRWNFGVNAADTSNAVHPNKVYPANGNYNVKLVATSGFGCKDSITKQMVVYAKPAQAFSINDTDQCVNGNNFVFTNGSTITPAVGLSYFWAFGNGDTSTQTNPSKVYAAAGTYPVKLRVTSVHGCMDSVTKNVYVYPKPTPNFTINDTVQCFGPNSFAFTNTSGISSGTLTYFWRFNVLSATDTSNLTNPTKTYNTDGTFTIRLRATSDKGCKDSIEKQVIVRPNIVNNAISTPQFICQNSVPDTLRQAAGSVSGGSSTYTFQWQQSTDSVNWSNIGGATANRYGSPALSVTTWYRRIITSGPCMDTSNVVKVHVTPSIVNNIINSPQVICYAQTPAQLTSGSPGGGNGTYNFLWQQSADTTTWNTAVNTNTGQQYQPPSLTDTIYYRRRIVSGVCTTFSNILKIAVKPLPVVNFNNTTECFPNLTQFTDTSTVNQGTNVAWNWTFGDNTSSTQQNPSHQYAAGTYTAKLVVTTNFGCRDSLSKSVTIHPKPQAGFSTPDVCLGFTSSFTDTSKVSTGSITGWSWAFDNGFTSAAQSPTHTYSTHGTYNVRLVVTTDRNCRDTILKPLVVSPAPVAKYGVSTECFSTATQFTDSSTVATGTITSRVWTFGDGNGSTANNPTHSYAGAGGYVSKLVVTTDRNCKDSTTRGVTVHPLPVVSFNGDTIECINRNVFYSNTSTGAFFYKWVYGDGDTSNGTVGSNIFDNPGYYRVSLIGRTVYGCVDSAFKIVRIVTPPNPVFSLLPDSGCAPLNVNFVNTSTGDFTNYNWNFGNGQSSNNYSPNPVTFQQSLVADTLYRIHLSATNLCGTRDAYDTVKVFPRPVANFGPDATSGCTPKVFNFTNTSSGFPQTYFWDFGNGNTSSAANPGPQLYTADSVIKTYTIRLRVVNNCGTDTVSRNVTVLPKNAKSLFGVDTLEGCPPLNIKITDFSQGATLVSYDLGDGNTSNLRNPSHTYTDTGVYTIRQFITNTCTFDTSQLQIRVLPVPPVSFSKLPSNQCTGQDIQFIANSPGATGFKWEFGTGDTSVFNNPKYKYPAPGVYTVRLSIVSGINNCRNSAQDTIRINPLPVPQLTTDKIDGCPVLSVQFTNTTPNTSFITWKFGDGNSSSVVNPVHQYTTTGAYLAWMIINANNGCVDSVSRLITVHPVPVASFTHNSTYCDVPVIVNFSNTSVGATTYNWDFGNSTTSGVTNPSVQYTALGVYNPVLTATNQFGCEDTASATFEINRKPEPQFTIDSSEGCPPLTVQFRDTSQFGTSWFWDFGDGFTSTTRNPTHVFNTSGNYNVKLKVSAGGNCSDSITLGSPIEVYPDAVAGFSHAFDQNPNNYGTVLFTDQSQNASKYFWEFGNGTTSDQSNPSVRYPVLGSYFIRQIIETDRGCKDTATALIELPFFGGLFVPNAFTPGLGGSEVSVFKPVAVSLKTYRLAIYDAWGKLLWQTELLDNTMPVEGWDGKYEGKDCAQDVYVWRIDATYLDGSPWPGMKGPDGKYHREGTVTLLR